MFQNHPFHQLREVQFFAIAAIRKIDILDGEELLMSLDLSVKICHLKSATGESLKLLV